MRVVRIILRVAAGLLATGFAVLAAAMPLLGVFNLWNEGGLSAPHPDGWLLGLTAYGLTILAFCLFSAIVSFAFFRYARYGALRRTRGTRDLGHRPSSTGTLARALL